MAEGEVNVGVEAKLKNLGEVEKLVASLNKAVEKATELQKRLTLKVSIDQKGFAELDQHLNKLGQAKNAKAVSNELRAENIRAPEDRNAAAVNNFVRRQIGRINADLDNVVASVLDHFTKSVERRMKTNFESIEARLNQAQTRQLTQNGLYSNRSQSSLVEEAGANTALGRQQRQRNLVRAASITGLSDADLASIENARFTKRAAAEERNDILDKARARRIVIAEIANEGQDIAAARRITKAEYQKEQSEIRYARRITAAEYEKEKAEKKAAEKAARVPNAPRTTADRVNDINDVVQQRLSQNGGADFLKIQGQILANYTLLSTAFNAFKSTITNVVELERELKQFAAITQTTDTEMKGFEQNLLKIAAGSKFTATEVAAAATVMGQAGLSAKQVSESLQAVINLATASGSTLKESVDIVTSSLTVFNLNSTEAGRVANVLTAALNLSKLSMDKLSLGIQYAGNIAADAGLSLTELTAVLGGLANSGIRSGSTLGTGVRQLLLELLNPTEKAKEVFKDLKISLADIDIRSNGLAGALDNLKKAGFTTADAMRAFETRTVAAYSAASRSIETIKSLEAQTLLTSAATEAAAKQMTSLANTWARFVASFTGATYTGLKPTLDILTSILSAAGTAVGALNQIPVATTIVGTALAGLAGGAAVAWTGRLILGLLGINAQLSLMSVSLPRVAASVGLFAAATGTATGAATLLTTALRFLAANPIILGITAVAGIYGLVKAFGDWNDALDKTNAKLNESKGRQQQTQTTVDGLTESIDKLYRRQEQLKKDPVLLRNAILEARQAFGQYGLQLDENTTSVEQLIAAHKRLRDIKLQTIPGELGSQLKTEQEKLKIQTTQLNSRSGNRQLAQGLADILGVNGNSRAVTRAAGREFGTAGTTAANLLNDPTKASLAQVQNAAGGLAITSADLRGQINKLDPNSPEVKVLEKKINTIADIVALLRKLEQSLGGIEATKLSIEDTTRQQRVADIQALQGPGSFGDLQNDLQRATGAQRGRLDSILKGNLKSEEGLGQFRIAQGEATVEANNIKVRIDAYKDKLKGQGFSDAEISKALESLYTSAASLSHLYLTQIKDTTSAYNEASKVVNEAEKDRINSQLKNLEKQSTKTKETGSLAELREKYIEKFAELEANAYKEAERESAGDPEKFQTIWKDKRQQLAAQKDTALVSFATRNEKILKDAFNGLIEEIDTEIKALGKQILELRNRIKDQRLTGAPADEVLKQINEKQNQVGLLEYQKGMVGTRNTSPAPTLGSGGGSKADAIIQAANNLGIDPRDLAAAISYETGGSFDPGKVGGKNNNHVGLIQFGIPERAKYGASGDQSFEEQMKAVEAYLKDRGIKPGMDLSDLYRTINGGNPKANLNASDGNGTISEHIDRISRQHYGNADKFLGVKPNSEEATRLEGRAADLKRQKDDATDDVIKNLNKNLSDVERNANVVSSRALGQAKGLQADQILDTTIPTVKKAYDELEQKSTAILKEEIERRTALGEQTKDLDEKLAQKEQEIGSKRQSALTTAFEAYERQAKEEAGKPVKDRQAELDRLRNSGETIDDNRINKAQLALDKAKSEQAAKEAAILQQKQTLTSTEVGSVQERLTAQRVATEQQLQTVQQQKLALEQNGIITGTEYEAVKARELQLSRDLESAKLNEKNGTQESIDAKTREVSTSNELIEAKRREVAASQAVASSASQIAQGQVSSWMKSNNLTDKNGNALGLDQQLAKQTAGLLTGISGALSTFISNLAMGKASLKDFGVSILKVFLDMFSKMAANNLIGALTGSLGGGGGGGLLGGLFKANGGMIPYRRAGGGGNPAPFRDSVHTVMQPGEYVLKTSAARAIGYDQLDDMNNRGPAAMSKSGVKPIQQIIRKDPDHFNVWMVDKENVPQPGPRDFVAAVGDNIIRSGELKQLIKSVQIGAI